MPNKVRSKYALSKMSATFVEHSPLLRKFLARFFSNRQDIEDVAQEAYLRAYVAEQKQNIENPKAFLFRVAKNVALTALTKKSKQIAKSLEDSGVSGVLATESSAIEEAEADETLVVFCDAVAKLPYKCREVFLLRKVHGLSHKEISERMSLSASSVEKYIKTGMSACMTAVNSDNKLRNGVGTRGRSGITRLTEQ